MANSNLIQRHPFHLVDQSPWPFVAGMSALSLTTGFVMYMHCYEGGFMFLVLGSYRYFSHFLFGGEISYEKVHFKVIIQKLYKMD